MEEKKMKEEMGKNDIWSKFQLMIQVIIQVIIQVLKVLSFILLIGVLLIRVLSEWGKLNANISNETIGFAIVIALIFFFLKE